MQAGSRVAIVTGGARGIGRYIADTVLAADADMALSGHLVGVKADRLVAVD
jgi:NAD(P)-dependent dehydrogenase (short-subunit alcohol dehydrogenase family)